MRSLNGKEMSTHTHKKKQKSKPPPQNLKTEILKYNQETNSKTEEPNKTVWLKKKANLLETKENRF